MSRGQDIDNISSGSEPEASAAFDPSRADATSGRGAAFIPPAFRVPFIADLEAEIDGLLPLIDAYLADAPISHDVGVSRG